MVCLFLKVFRRFMLVAIVVLLFLLVVGIPFGITMIIYQCYCKKGETHYYCTVCSIHNLIVQYSGISVKLYVGVYLYSIVWVLLN